jgi:hypothetical protein
MAIRATWIVCDTEGFVQCDDETAEPVEYKTAEAALKAADAQLRHSDDDERWVYKLAHVVMRDVSTSIEDVK